MTKLQLVMTLALRILTICIISLYLTGCTNETRASVLQKCTILGEESISYARANYIKLFHYFNPKKFDTSYQRIKDYDHVTHRNVINTYTIAVRKLKAKDPTTKALLLSCINLADFSKNFVDQSYPRAIAHKSNENPLSDIFFTQINQIVKFDDSIGVFEKNAPSFKQYILDYKKALKQFRERFKDELSNR